MAHRITLVAVGKKFDYTVRGQKVEGMDESALAKSDSES